MFTVHRFSKVRLSGKMVDRKSYTVTVVKSRPYERWHETKGAVSDFTFTTDLILACIRLGIDTLIANILVF